MSGTNESFEGWQSDQMFFRYCLPPVIELMRKAEFFAKKYTNCSQSWLCFRCETIWDWEAGWKNWLWLRMIKIPTVTNFCCFFELSTGGLILGWIDVVIYGLTLLILIVNMLFGMKFFKLEDLNQFSIFGEIKIKNYFEKYFELSFTQVSLSTQLFSWCFCSSS